MDFATLLSLGLVVMALVKTSRLKARVLVLEAKIAQLLAPSAQTASPLDEYKQRRQSVPLNRVICGLDGGAKLYRSC